MRNRSLGDGGSPRVAGLGHRDERVFTAGVEQTQLGVGGLEQSAVPGGRQPSPDAGVALQQCKRQVTVGVWRQGGQPFHDAHQRRHASLDGLRVAHALAHLGPLQRRADQVAQTAASARHSLDHRHAQGAFQGGGVYRHALVFRLIYQIQRHHDGHSEVHQLQRQVKVAFQVARVQHVDRHLGGLVEQGGAGDQFLGGVRAERVGSRQVEKLHPAALVGQAGLALLDGHSRPVAHLEVCARQPVDERGLADVGVAHDHRPGSAGRPQPRDGLKAGGSVVNCGLSQYLQG